MTDRVNNDVHVGLMKATFGMALKQHGPEIVDSDDAAPPITTPLIQSALTAFMLQMVSLFDEGLDAWMEQEYPKQGLPSPDQPNRVFRG
jgi:hypothetical protein